MNSEQLTEESIRHTWLQGGTPLVSITCIVYNHEKWIAEALTSFLCQRTTFPFEIIVHDDASTDNSQEIIRDFARRFPTIIKPILQTENHWKGKGINATTTIVWPGAVGKYIAWCEGDDYWVDLFKIQKQFAYMEAHQEVSLCYTNARIDDVNNSLATNYFSRNADECLTYKEVLTHFVGPTCTFFFRKKTFIEEFGVPSWYNKVNSADDFLIFVMAAYGSIAYLNFVGGCYRPNPNGFGATINHADWISSDALLKSNLISIYPKDKRNEVRKILFCNTLNTINFLLEKDFVAAGRKVLFRLNYRAYLFQNKPLHSLKLFGLTVIKAMLPKYTGQIRRTKNQLSV